MAESEHGELTVKITSVDGNMTQSFSRNTKVGEVRQIAYDNLVQDKTTVPLSATTIEFRGGAVTDSTSLKDLLKKQNDERNKDDKKDKDFDLLLSLTWVSQGGITC
jgi:hypothetical protein